MKLEDIIDLYSGDIRVAINSVDTATGNVSDVIVCELSETDALKADILSANVIKFDVILELGKPVIGFYI